MHGRWVRGLAVLLAAVLPAPVEGATRDARGTGTLPRVTSSPSSTRNLPTYFEANRGQADPQVRYIARPRGFRAYFTDTDAVFVLPGGAGKTLEPGSKGPAIAIAIESDVIRMRLEGGSPHAPSPRGHAVPGVSNYFLGRDPEKWVTGVPHFEGLRAADVLPGVGLHWRGLPEGGLEYDLHLKPHADPGSIVMGFEGADSIALDGAGDLLLKTRRGVLRHSKPVAWQGSDRDRRIVPCDFLLLPPGRVGFRLGNYDPAFPVVLDPRVSYSTYLGGASIDSTLGLAIDSSGAAYMCGFSQSSDFPVASAYQGTTGGGISDAVVTKVSASGGALVHSTYIGGSSYDVAFGLALDANGAVYLCGQTTSPDFPTVGAIQPTWGTSDDVFVAKLSPSGSQLSYSTYLGGNSNDYGYAVAVDSSGAAYVTGATAGSGFPIVAAFQGTKGAGFDAFVAKINASGSSLTYSSFLGGSGTEYGRAITVDSSGAAFVVGQTSSTNFPVVGAFQTVSGGGNEAFITKVGSTGAAVTFSSYLGGSGSEDAFDVVVDGQGIATIVGSTTSANFPVQSPLYGTFAGAMDGFASRISANGASMSTSTYLGGSGSDIAYAVALDSAGSTLIVGSTSSTNFPVQSALQGSNGGGAGDAFVMKFTAGMAALVYSTYLGGSGDDEARAAAFQGTDVYVAGRTNSTNFPMQGPYQGTLAGSYDAFAVKVITTPLAPTNASSSLIAVDAVEVTWQDNSDDETGFELQRRIGAGAYSTLLIATAGSTVYDDLGLESGTKYTYRLRTLNPDGMSGWSNETSTTTPPAIPGVPLAPSGLTVEQTSATAAGLSWTDESTDENFFQVQRMTGTGTWQVIATPGPNQTTYADTGILPDRTYAYRVRAANGIGFSSYSQIETLESPPSLAFLVTKGLIKDSVRISRDVLKLSGSWSTNDASPDGGFDPMTDGLEVRLDSRDGPVVFLLAPNAEGWTTRNGRNTWKTPRGSITHAKLVATPASGTWSLSLTRTTLPPMAGSPFTFSLSIGNDAGTQSADWRPNPRREGVFKLP